MWNALFAFENPSRAQDGLQRLLDSGFPSEAVKEHRRASGPPDAGIERLDEQVTGGVLSNLYNLFQGVMDWGNSPHDAASYEAVEIRGGVVLEASTAEASARELVDSVLGASADRHTDWRQVL